MNGKVDTPLCIAISTIGQRSSFLISMIRQSKSELNNADEVIIVIQDCNRYLEKTIYEEWKNNSINSPLKIIIDQKRGLSRSRNLALKAANADYIWILDDDVKIICGSIDKIKNEISLKQADILCGRIQCFESNSLFKKYVNPRRLRKIDVLKVMSIEMIISKNFCQKFGIFFSEQIGLGTHIPAGAETLFLIDAHEHGAIIHHFAVIIARHICDENNFIRKWSKPQVLQAKGMVARRMGPIFGPLLVLRWGIRGIKKGLDMKCFLPIMEGFIKGNRLINKNNSIKV